MTKYKRFEAIGNGIIGFGVAVGVISASIDIDHSSSVSALQCAIGGCILGLMLILVGFAFCNLRKVEGCLISATLVMCAWLHKTLHFNGKTFKASYVVVHKLGGYSSAFVKCYAKYVV